MGVMINEHALTFKGEITVEDLIYMVKKAHRIGKSGRDLIRVFVQEDEEGKHVYFEVEALKQKDVICPS